MKTFSDVINRWKSAAQLAADMGEKPVTVRQWRSRNNVPSEKWRVLIGVAQSRGFNDITLDLLASLAASKGRLETSDCAAGSAGQPAGQAA